MRRLIGKTDPTAARRQVECQLWALLLVVLVGFHSIVQVQHQVVVMAAAAFGDADLMLQPTAQGRIARQARYKTPCQLGEGFTDAPLAMLAVRIDVGKNTQDTLTLIGA
ncbi:hypothetical protein D3C81_607040 [compost metagenome]